MSQPPCFQCGLPVPPDARFTLDIDGQPRAFCCAGCQAVAQLIRSVGLDSFYQYRDSYAPPDTARAREEVETTDFSVYDRPAIRQSFVRELGDDCYQTELYVEGIQCAACAWLIESYLSRQPGVERVSVNSASHRCLLEWREPDASLSQLLQQFHRLGYGAEPAMGGEGAATAGREHKKALMRLAVAGIGMVQVGMFAVALYAGALQDMSPGWQWFLRWVSALVATPVVFYSARPFFTGARRALQARHLTMDVPVALAIGLAYAASCWATITNRGEVYFDSVSMFTFFLLLGRYLEMRVRHRNENAVNQLSSLLPPFVLRMAGPDPDASREAVPLQDVVAGDYLWIKEGEVIPADGELERGSGHVDESMLTGEPTPIYKTAGDGLAAGTLNLDGGLLLKVAAVGQATRLSAIQQLMAGALHEKPQQVSRADRLAGYFVGALLVIAMGVAGVWLSIEPENAFWVTLSVLVVTCPCALSLATPVSLTAAIYRLRQMGLLITRAHGIEALSRVNRVVFDKTGTLTAGRVTLQHIRLAPGSSATETQVLNLAASLEEGSRHPLAQVFCRHGVPQAAQNLRQVPGRGVEGEVVGQRYRLGQPQFVAALSRKPPPTLPPTSLSKVWLGSEDGILAQFELADPLRPEAWETVAALRERGVAVELLSGDHNGVVAEVAAALELSDYRGGVSPEEKLQHLRSRQAAGDRILMVGDGLNDLPVLSGADMSVAMASASDLAQLQADSVLLHDDLRAIPAALGVAGFCQRLIRQNLTWAIGYNLGALPLAALGFVPPYLAAIGMSLSSLIVVLNATRLYGFQRHGQLQPLANRVPSAA